MHHMVCEEIWGGIEGDNLDVTTCGVVASLFSRACDGGRGGDLYYFSVCASDLLTRIAVADVAGHGEAVSKTSQWLFDSLKRRMNSANSNEVLADLNQLAAEEGEKAISTAVVAAFYLADDQLHYSYAGHHPILIRRQGDDRWSEAELDEGIDAGNFPLGVIEDSSFTESQRPLASGDLLFAYTDGLIEAPDSNEELFGLDRLFNILNETTTTEPDQIKKAVADSLLTHTGGRLNHDDVTFIAVRIR